MLKDVILNSPKNLIIAYLNLISIRNEITDLKILLQDISLDYFVLSETKLGNIFLTAKFHIPGYWMRSRRDRNKKEVV